MTVGKYHEICDYLRDVTDASQWEGHVYAVGGCCRDELLGLPIKDVDLAVDLPGGGIGFAEWLDSKGLTEGKTVMFPMFGTARFTLRRFPGEEIEVVQTRREKYTDRNTRHPETAFGSIKEDAIRRDLTINAIYRDLRTGEYLDVNGTGMDDLRHHLIRTPADPDMTYDDDPVRILRCIRFAARLGWEIAPATYQGMVNNIPRLSIVSAPRMRNELEKMLSGERPEQVLELMRKTGALRVVMPEICPMFELTQNSLHGGTVWQQTLDTVKGVGGDPVLRMAALLHDIGKVKTRCEKDGRVSFGGHDRVGAAMTKGILRRLKFPRPFSREVEFLVRHHTALKQAGADGEKITDEQLRRLQVACRSRERWERLLELIEADNQSYAEGHRLTGQVDAIRRRTADMEARGESMLDFRLPVSLRQVCRMKRVRRGPALRECMDYLWHLACENPSRPAEEYLRLLRAFRPEKGRKKPKQTEKGTVK